MKVTELTEEENAYQKGIVADVDQKKIPKPMESW